MAERRLQLWHSFSGDIPVSLAFPTSQLQGRAAQPGQAEPMPQPGQQHNGDNPTGVSSAGKGSSSARGTPALLCQVAGCPSPSLVTCKEYHRRYRICQMHRKMDQLVRSDGEIQRFCQQCGRFHHISAFDENKRSCRDRLARHNERRRRRTAAGQSASGNEPHAANAGQGGVKHAPAAQPSGSGGWPSDLNINSSGGVQHHNSDNGWGQHRQLSGELPVVPNATHSVLNFWENRHMQFLQMQGLQQASDPQTMNSLTAAVDAARQCQQDPTSLLTQRLEGGWVAGMPVAFNSMQSAATAASDYSSDISSHLSDTSASYTSLGLLAQSRLPPRMLPGCADAMALASLQPAHSFPPPAQTLRGPGPSSSPLELQLAAVARQAAEDKARRKTLSWPLALIRVEESSMWPQLPPQLSLLGQADRSVTTGATGSTSGVGADNQSKHRHLFSGFDAAVMKVRDFAPPAMPFYAHSAAAGPSYHSEGVLPKLGDGTDEMQHDIKVLGGNQSLGSILENIMLLDDPADNHSELV